jgi:hypothetical protein
MDQLRKGSWKMPTTVADLTAVDADYRACPRRQKRGCALFVKMYTHAGLMHRIRSAYLHDRFQFDCSWRAELVQQPGHTLANAGIPEFLRVLTTKYPATDTNPPHFGGPVLSQNRHAEGVDARKLPDLRVICDTAELTMRSAHTATKTLFLQAYTPSHTLQRP